MALKPNFAQKKILCSSNGSQIHGLPGTVGCFTTELWGTRVEQGHTTTEGSDVRHACQTTGSTM